MSISDVLSDGLGDIMRYLYDENGQRDWMYDDAWVKEKLLPVMTAMHALLRELDTPPDMPQSHPLHCVYCEMDFPDVIAIQYHVLFTGHFVGDAIRGKSGEDKIVLIDDEDDEPPF